MWAALRNFQEEAKRIRITALGKSIKNTELGVTKAADCLMYEKTGSPRVFRVFLTPSLCIIEVHAFTSSSVIYERYNNEQTTTESGEL